ncbi:laminin subunit alpha-2, partial [Tachysurus ichikawai]
GGGLHLTDRQSKADLSPRLAGMMRRRVSLTPESFRHYDSNAAVSKSDIIRVLLNIRHIRVRAADCQQHSLSSVSMEVASADSRSGVQARAVEVCVCPHGYTGTSCETCKEGYRRINGTLHQGVCELCHCHGHTSHCDDITGQCLGCKHHTTGLNCDVCAPGYYGDATRGTLDDCQPCACPLQTASNNFSPTCHQDKDGYLVCDRCRVGYGGPRCDR